MSTPTNPPVQGHVSYLSHSACMFSSSKLQAQCRKMAQRRTSVSSFPSHLMEAMSVDLGIQAEGEGVFPGEASGSIRFSVLGDKSGHAL